MLARRSSSLLPTIQRTASIVTLAFQHYVYSWKLRDKTGGSFIRVDNLQKDNNDKYNLTRPQGREGAGKPAWTNLIKKKNPTDYLENPCVYFLDITYIEWRC